MIIVNAPEQLTIGQSTQLTVDPIQDVTWLSSDLRVARVSTSGVVEAVTAGNVEITAINNSDERAVAVIRVVSAQDITRLEIVPQFIQLQLGQTFPLSLQITPSNGDESTLVWQSSRPEVVGLDGTIVTALRYGTSVISVTVPNGVTSSMRVEVLTNDQIEPNGPCDTTQIPVNKEWLHTDRIYAQYRSFPKFMKWFNITRELGYPLYQAIQIVRKMYDIDNNVGAQLDIIGRIVGISRRFVYESDIVQSQYAETPHGAEYGIASSMYRSGVIDMQGNMSDSLYRLVLKAKIIKNNNGATFNDIIRAFRTLFPSVGDVYITDYEDMSYEITYEGDISDIEKWALLNVTLIPKPAGVRIRGFIGIPFGYTQMGDETMMFGDTNAEMATVRND